MKFNNSEDYGSNKVIFNEDEFDNVGHFFFVADTTSIFDWVLEFEEGFKSDLTTEGGQSSATTLRDLQDRDINILGTEYAIVEALLDAESNETSFQFLGGPVYDALGEGDKKSYTLNGKEYELEVIIISETLNDNQGEVLIKVNGETLPRMRGGEVEPTADGTLIGIRDIIPTGKDTQSSVVRFYLGASKIEMKDTSSDGSQPQGFRDDIFTNAGAVINNEIIEDAQVKIKATVNSGATQATVESVTYRLISDALVGDLFVPPWSWCS